MVKVHRHQWEPEVLEWELAKVPPERPTVMVLSATQVGLVNCNISNLSSGRTEDTVVFRELSKFFATELIARNEVGSCRFLHPTGCALVYVTPKIAREMRERFVDGDTRLVDQLVYPIDASIDMVQNPKSPFHRISWVQNAVKSYNVEMTDSSSSRPVPRCEVLNDRQIACRPVRQQEQLSSRSTQAVTSEFLHNLLG